MPTSRGGRQVYQNLAWRLGFVESIAAYFFRNMAKGWLRGSRRGVKGSYIITLTVMTWMQLRRQGCFNSAGRITRLHEDS